MIRHCGLVLYCEHVGQNDDVGKNARVSSKLSIGDNSGIGDRAHIQGRVIMGRDIMMAPEVAIIATNHNFGRSDIPMNRQGHTNKSIIIGDDCWLGYRAIICAVNIAFANELAKICRHDNMDVYEIVKICNMHPRVNILQPGPGVGGHCISVDPWFLVGDYPSLAKVIDESMKTNDGMPDFVLNRIYEIMKEKGMTDITRVGLYGLTYKENVDDMRESPTLQLLESQERHLATGLKDYDPFITKEVVANQYHSLDEFLGAVDFVVVMVKHDEIKKNMDKLKGKVVLDCHNIINMTGVYHI